MTADMLRRRSKEEELKSLRTLELRGGERLGRVPRLENLGLLKSLTSLDVSGNALTSLAPLGANGAPALTSLDASGNLTWAQVELPARISEVPRWCRKVFFRINPHNV